MAGDNTSPTPEEAFRAALSARPDLGREEPEIAANIGVQMGHMGLDVPTVSVVRRIRDIVATLQPKKVAEVGAGIGHTTAWLLDAWTRDEVVAPMRVDIMEQGNRFAVILDRVIKRYAMEAVARVVVGDVEDHAPQTRAWRLAHVTNDDLPPTLMDGLDVVVLRTGPEGLGVRAAASMDLLRKGGVLLLIEPPVPGDNIDDSTEEGAAIIAGFNAWIAFVHRCSEEHDLAFVPVHGGTIVAVRKLA
ncbi:MAG: hypothetical protein CMA08_02595 [Euryarchaeota archaeon]|nr:hypothetical protein [Euryarchaeota archaeon]OUX22523.1 MAG: hypothetical protein CBE12_01985 [Euryarchaeota archaeon TMED252]